MSLSTGKKKMFAVAAVGLLIGAVIVYFMNLSKEYECKDGYSLDGNMCVRPKDTKTLMIGDKKFVCATGYNMVGDKCVKVPQTLGRGLGVTGGVVNSYKCPSGFTHNGVSGAGWCSKGGLWGLGGETAYEIPVPVKPYPAYSKSPGVSNEIETGINTGWEKCGLLYYPKCPTGMTKVGCNICKSPNVPLACEDSEAHELVGTDCYIKCPTGYTRNEDKLCVRPKHSLSPCPPSKYAEYKVFKDGKCYKS